EAAVAVGRDRDTEAGLLVDAHDAGVVGHGAPGVAAHVAVVLVGDPGLVAQVGRGEQVQQGRAQVLRPGQPGGGVGLHGVEPLRAGVGPLVDGAVVGDGA